MTITDLKYFTVKAIKFIVIIVIVDLSIGYISKTLFRNQKSGKYARITHSIYDASPEVLILGSSHATRHYVSQLMSEELQKSCYNAGVRGQGITFINPAVDSRTI
jgi:hypothetical protein